MLDKDRMFRNVLNECFFEMFVKSNQGIREFCEKRCLDIEEVKDILFRRVTPSLSRLTELLNCARVS